MRIAKDPILLYSQGICWSLCRTLTRSAPILLLYCLPLILSQSVKKTLQTHISTQCQQQKVTLTRGEEKEWLKKTKETKRGAQGGKKAKQQLKTKIPFFLLCVTSFSHSGSPCPFPGSGIKWPGLLGCSYSFALQMSPKMTFQFLKLWKGRGRR